MEEHSDYSKGKLDGKQEEFREKIIILEREISHWKISFGWTLAGLILLAIIGFIILASTTSYIGYSPEQVSDIAIKICKELNPLN